MTPMDLKLIKIINSHYYQLQTGTTEKVQFNGRTYFDKFKRIDKLLLNRLLINI